MDTLERSEVQQQAHQYRMTDFDYPMPPLKAENMNNDGVISLYEAVIERAKLDYIDHRKRILKGFGDAYPKIRQRKRRFAEKQCHDIMAFFENLGITGDRKEALEEMLNAEAETWWQNYKKNAREKAAKEWTEWGMCLDDDIY